MAENSDPEHAWTLNIIKNYKKWNQENNIPKKDELKDVSTEDEIPFVSNLILLWDMSMNITISNIVFEEAFHRVIWEIADKTNMDRLKEICIGIVANMVSFPNIANNVSHDASFWFIAINLIYSQHIFQLFTSSMASEVLYECFRFFKNLAQSEIPNAPNSLVCSGLIQKIIFILHYSSNVNLIKSVAELICILIEKDLMQPLIVEEDRAPTVLEANFQLFDGLVEALNQAINMIPYDKVVILDCKNIIHAVQLILSEMDSNKLSLIYAENPDRLEKQLISSLVQFIDAFNHFALEDEELQLTTINPLCLNSGNTIYAALFIIQWILGTAPNLEETTQEKLHECLTDCLKVFSNNVINNTSQFTYQNQIITSIQQMMQTLK